jgi:hypothetical protein
MKKILVHIEMDLPFLPDEITLPNLRKLEKEIRYAQGCSVVLWLLCDQAQEDAVQHVTGFVWARQYGKHFPPAPNEIGAAETFRFVRKDRRARNGENDRRQG